MTDLVLRDLKDRVLMLSINRPDKKNALTAEIYDGLAAGIHEARADSAIRAVLVTGTADCFTSGHDVGVFAAGGGGEGTAFPALSLMNALIDMSKPVVAAVNGAAVGIGTTLLLHCDLVYAGESARFQMPFTALGVCPEFASSFLLPMFLGHARAAELLLLAERFGARKAYQCGLVTRVVPDDRTLATAQDAAARLAALPPHAMRETKALMKRWNTGKVREVMEVESELFLELMKGPEAKEAFSAFLQKRKPDFSGFTA